MSSAGFEQAHYLQEGDFNRMLDKILDEIVNISPNEVPFLDVCTSEQSGPVVRPVAWEEIFRKTDMVTKARKMTREEEEMAEAGAAEAQYQIKKSIVKAVDDAELRNAMGQLIDERTCHVLNCRNDWRDGRARHHRSDSCSVALPD